MTEAKLKEISNKVDNEIEIISYSQRNGIKYTEDEFLVFLYNLKKVIKKNGEFLMSKNRYFSRRFH